MRVKIENTWYSADETAIAVELSDKEREQLLLMEPGTRIYCQHPSTADLGYIREWMYEGSKLEQRAKREELAERPGTEEKAKHDDQEI